MTEQSNHDFEFGPYRLDSGERLLWRGDEVVPLTSGAKGFWEKMLELRIENMKRGSTVSPTLMAQAYARTGDKDRAFEWLEKAYAERDLFLVSNIKVEAVQERAKARSVCETTKRKILSATQEELL